MSLQLVVAERHAGLSFTTALPHFSCVFLTFNFEGLYQVLLLHTNLLQSPSFEALFVQLGLEFFVAHLPALQLAPDLPFLLPELVDFVLDLAQFVRTSFPDQLLENDFSLPSLGELNLKPLHEGSGFSLLLLLIGGLRKGVLQNGVWLQQFERLLGVLVVDA